MHDHYLTLKNQARSEVMVKKSRFITSASPVNDEQEAIEFVKAISSEHKKATHNVFAYVINEQSQKYNDDGEPGGTAGIPVLEVISQKGLSEAVLVVSRYFGGIKLGAGGLVRAYKEAAVKGIEAAGVLEKLLYYDLSLIMDYQWLGLVKREVENAGGRGIDIRYGENVELKVFLRPAVIQKVSERLNEATAAQIEIHKGKAIYLSGADIP